MRFDSVSDVPGLSSTLTVSVPSLNGGRKERGKNGTLAATMMHHGQRPGQQAARMVEGPVQQFCIPAFEPDDQRTVASMQLLHARQQVVGHHRRHRHRNDHAGENGNDVGHAQRREQAPFDAGQHEQRHEHQHDDHRGIDDGRAHFQRRRGDHFRHRAWRRGQTVQLQPAQHVLDTDHGIVHQFADGDGQAAQRHGVDRQAEVMEDQRRDQQRHRDRRQRNHRGADIEQEQEQDHRHQDRPVAQRFLDVVHRVLDEVGLLEEEVGCLDAGGRLLLSSATAFSTSRVSATLSAAGCFCTDRMTAGLPL